MNGVSKNYVTMGKTSWPVKPSQKRVMLRLNFSRAAGSLRKGTPPWRRPRSGNSCGTASGFPPCRRTPPARSLSGPAIPRQTAGSNPPPQIHVRQLLRPGPGMRRQTAYAPRAQCRQRFHQILHPHHRLLEDRAHGTGDRPALERTAARFAHNQKMRAKRRAAPHHRAEIFRAGNALRSGEQQRTRRLFKEGFKIRLRRDSDAERQPKRFAGCGLMRSPLSAAGINQDKSSLGQLMREDTTVMWNGTRGGGRTQIDCFAFVHKQ